MQQMALMAYKAPPAGGADSAYLITGQFDGGDSSIGPATIVFNTASGPTGNVDYIGNLNESYVWKTGPNPYTDYSAKFIKTFQSGPSDVSGSAVNTSINMAVDTPSWTLETNTLTSRVEGYLVILSPSLVELANVQVILQTNQFA